jgi:cytochrome c oxidase subunit III
MSDTATANSHHHEVRKKGDPPHLHHADPHTAYEASKFGMWLFLATELLLFGVMFAAFALFRWRYFDEFAQGSSHLNWVMGSVNTVILLLSSYCAARAVTSAQEGKSSEIVKWLVATIAFAGGFLIVKFFEYRSKYVHGYFPGGEHFSDYKAFLGIYFTMTGIHGLHVIIGMAFLGWVAYRASREEFSERYYTPVEMGALYWHLVDLIWIYLFPLLYLVG